MSGSGRETLSDVPDCSGDPSECSGVVGWPYRMSMSGRESLPDVWEWWEALTDIREWSKDPPKSP